MLLPHITKNRRELRKRTFWRTDDPDVVIVLTTAVQQFSKSQMQTRLQELNNEITTTPGSILSYPVDATDEMKAAIDAHNEEVRLQALRRETLIRRRQEILDDIAEATN